MTGSENDVVLGRHLDSLSAVVAGKLATITGGNGVVLPTTANLVAGGLWLDTADKVPKFYFGGKVYPLLCGEGEIPLPAKGKTAEEYTWEQISTISQAGKGADYFNIGDTKKITLNGKIGDCLELDNEELYVYILHFNYPMNGTPDNNIIWGGFKTADGKDVALCDSKFTSNATSSAIYFSMNHQSDPYRGALNYGGWKGADFRYDILGATSTPPSDYGIVHTTSCTGYDATDATLTSPKANTLLAALPSDMRNALRLWSRWIDAKGNNSNVEANIEETIDAVTLLTEWEVHGAQDAANKYEQNHQTQMEYFKNGNGKIKCHHNSTSTGVQWWLSSPRYNSETNFCVVTPNGTFGNRDGSYSWGLAPAFKT